MEQREETVTIPFQDSTITGIKLRSFKGKEYYGFFGIRYAKPPIEELRFKPPQPIESYPKHIDATKPGDICMQKVICGYPKEKIVGSEDCLHLNIFIPKLPSKNAPLKPVFINIMGGGYIRSVSDQYPTMLIDYDIIFAYFSYRLHILGFLNLGLEECPGNVGLKDQVVALKWIISNIRYFGGDPNNITLHGTSAGGTSVHLFMISPLTKGLFQKAIISSGHALSPWSLAQKPVEYAFIVGRQLGYQKKDKIELLNYLKAQPAEDLLTAIYATKTLVEPCINILYGWNVFVPSVEFIQEGAFLPDIPEKLWKNANSISVLTGICENEGGLFFKQNGLINGYNEIDTVKAFIKAFITESYHLDEKLTNEICKEIEIFYFGSANNQSDVFSIFMMFCSDFMIKEYCCVFNFMRKGGLSQVFNYLFAYEGLVNYIKMSTTSIIKKSVKGSYHSDEYGYILENKNMKSTFHENDKNFSQKICSMWTHFAKTGNPNYDGIETEWEPSSETNPCYLHIDNKCTLVREEINGKRTAFWKYLMKKYAL